MRWELPGGKVDHNETPEQSIAREMYEETGVTVKAIQLLPFVVNNNWKYSWGIQQTFIFCFLCEYVKKRTRKPDHHVYDSAWVDIEKVLILDTLPGVDTFIQLALLHEKSNR